MSQAGQRGGVGPAWGRKDAGTTNVNAGLLDDLKLRTTYRPAEITKRKEKKRCRF